MATGTKQTKYSKSEEKTFDLTDVPYFVMIPFMKPEICHVVLGLFWHFIYVL